MKLSKFLHPLLVEVAQRDGSAAPDDIDYGTFEAVTQYKAMLHPRRTASAPWPSLTQPLPTTARRYATALNF